MHDWRSFLWAADEWIVTYSLLPLSLTHVHLFTIGHACELYLKAAHAKLTGDITGTVKHSHHLKALWDDCKQRSSSFMRSFDLVEKVYGTTLPELTSGLVAEGLSPEDRVNYIRHRELYIVFKMLPDLKYLGAPMKSVKGPYAMGEIFPNDYWIEYFRDMRAFLGHPAPKFQDAISNCLDEGELPQRSRQFLTRLYQ